MNPQSCQACPQKRKVFSKYKDASHPAVKATKQQRLRSAMQKEILRRN